MVRVGVVGGGRGGTRREGYKPPLPPFRRVKDLFVKRVYIGIWGVKDGGVGIPGVKDLTTERSQISNVGFLFMRACCEKMLARI